MSRFIILLTSLVALVACAEPAPPKPIMYEVHCQGELLDRFDGRGLNFRVRRTSHVVTDGRGTVVAVYPANCPITRVY